MSIHDSSINDVVPTPPRLQAISDMFGDIYARLTVCRSRIFSVRTEHGNVEYHPDQFLVARGASPHPAFDICLRVLRRHDKMKLLCDIARNVCQKIHDDEQQRARQQTGEGEGEGQQALTSFHLFPKLPAEIRLMVWERAARPPLSALYFEVNKPGPGSAINEPAALLMQDLGLWTACVDSRNTMVKAYAEQRARVEAAGATIDGLDSLDGPEMRHGNLIAHYNARFHCMKITAREIYRDLLACQEKKTAIIRRAIRCGGPAVEAELHEHWGGDAELPIAALKQVVDLLATDNLLAA